MNQTLYNNAERFDSAGYGRRSCRYRRLCFVEVVIVVIIFCGFARQAFSSEPADAGTVGRCCAGSAARPKRLAEVLGIAHVAGRYHLTQKDFLNEGADQILLLGSRVIKVWFHNPQSSYPFNSHWPEVSNLVELAQSPYFQQLFEKPFRTYVLMCFSVGRPAAYWRNGISAEEQQAERRQFYDLTKYLLTRYRHSDKTFVLQHWEGDWLIRGSYDPQQPLSQKAVTAMTAWLNARQQGVEQARRRFGRSGVKVYHAAEVNRVVSSMRHGQPNLVNTVIPQTRLDLVSYSAWDAATGHFDDPNVLRQALQYIAAHAPDSADFGDRNVYIGEFGMPENVRGIRQVQKAIPQAVKTALAWGCPYVIYWQLYCNELKDPRRPGPVKSNDAVRGFWLIRPDGSKAWTWNYFHGLLCGHRDKVAEGLFERISNRQERQK